MLKMPCFVIDIDMVLFDSYQLEKNIPKDRYDRAGWDEFATLYKTCKPNQDVIDYVSLAYQSGYKIIFITSREYHEECRSLEFTAAQIESVYDGEYELYMRQYCDYRPSCEVKEEILKNMVLPYHKIRYAIDDNISNCKMFSKYADQTICYRTIHNKYKYELS